MKKKLNIPKIDSYDQLIENLKKRNINPQEAWELIYKVKIGLDSKTVWKLDKFYQYVLERLGALYDIYPKAESDPKINSLYGKDHLQALKKLLPKRVDTIRKVVNSELYFKGFQVFNKNKKFDKRKEVKNLEKLIADKRQDEWWHPAWIDAIGDSWNKEKEKPIRLKFDKPGFRELLKILR